MKRYSRLTNDFIESVVRERMATDLVCVSEGVRSKVAAWRKAGAFVVGNAGAYDIMSVNHIRGLAQARILGAMYSLGEGSTDEDVYELASSDDIKLVVSLDTNAALEENKSWQDFSGGSIRPVLDWNTRAVMLAMQSFGGSHNMVDFVTRHGPGACGVCLTGDCLHENENYSVASAGVDVVVVKSGSDRIKELYPRSRFHIIDEQEGAFFDTVLCSQISTSAIVRRIRS